MSNYFLPQIKPVIKFNKIITYPLIFLFLFNFSIGITNVWAVASLAIEDRIDEIPVSIKGEDKSITVLRDAYNRLQFYYIPPEPRISERKFGSRIEPEFHLIRYQYRDPKNPEKELEGGILQFAATLSIDPEAISQLKTAISKSFNIKKKKKIRLSALPFKSAQVSLYTPSGEHIVSSSKGTGLAPTFSTQKMTFLVEFPPIGADIYDALTTGNTGIPVVVNFSYNGLTPKANISVYVDYRQAFKHFSSDKKFAARISTFWASASANYQNSQIREDLQKRKILKVDITGSDELLKIEEANKIVQPLVKSILDEITKDFAPPKKIDPAKAKDPKLGGGFVSVGYSLAKKGSVKKIRGKTKINYNFRKIMTSNTITSGFIGIGKYSDEIKKKLVTIVPPGPWRKAFFVLPNVPDDKDLGITQVDIQLSLLKEGRVLESVAAIWRNQEEGWKGVGSIGDKEAPSRNLLLFPLMSYTADDPSMKQINFVSKTSITQKRDVLVSKKQLDVTGEKIQDTLKQPIATVDIFQLDAQSLPWKKLEEDGTVTQVKYLVKTGKRKISGTLKPNYIDGEWTPPSIRSWLIKKSSDPNAQPVIAKILIKNSGKLIPWSNNGNNLRDLPGGLEVVLDEDDIQDDNSNEN